MEHLIRRYIDELSEPLAWLQTHRTRLNEPDIAQQAREIGHRLRGSAAAYGIGAVAAAGAMTEDAAPLHLPDRVDDLILAIEHARR